MNGTTVYYRSDLDREARAAVRDFRRRLPAAVRRTVKLDGWQLWTGTSGTRLAVLFSDEYGRHVLYVAI